MVVTPTSIDSPVDIPVVQKSGGPQRQISERSAFGTVNTDAESTCLSSVGSELEIHLLGTPAAEDSSTSPEEEEEETTVVPENSFSVLSVSTCNSGCSILKIRFTDLADIKDSKRAWKCMPKPDLKTIIGEASTSSETTTTALNDSLSSSRKGVEWGVVQIRSYGQTIGDNPSVSYGTPIQLDWDYEVHEAVDLVAYELNRGARRNLRQMVLSYYYRKNLLSWQYGFGEDEIKAAKKEANRVKFKRDITRSFLIAMPMEAAVESARRKTKRFFKKE